MVTKKTSADGQSGKSKKNTKPPIKKAKPELQTAQPTILGRPQAEDAVRLCADVMSAFITSKQEKSMEHFFHTIAKKWQELTSIEKLNGAFSVIIADPTNWDFLRTVQPTLIKDGINERGDWVAVGAYPTKPRKLVFEQIFINENNAWKLAELKLFTAD